MRHSAPSEFAIKKSTLLLADLIKPIANHPKNTGAVKNFNVGIAIIQGVQSIGSIYFNDIAFRNNYLVVTMNICVFRRSDFAKQTAIETIATVT